LAKRIFITATNTEIGKTYTTLALMRTLNALGVEIGVIKPIETGVEEIPADGEQLLRELKHLNPKAWAMDIEDVVPVQMRLPAAPYIARGNKPIDWDAIDQAIERMEAVCDVLLIEGAGGLLVPVDEKSDMIDLIHRYQAKALLVSHCRLGCINDTRLSLEALRKRQIAHEWVLNCRQSDTGFEQTSQPFFDDTYPEWFRLDRDIERLCTTLLL
jgi:dethiobiotin synthetase